MLGVFLSPHYATDHNVYLTYAEPGDEIRTSGLALARARLAIGAGTAASLEGIAGCRGATCPWAAEGSSAPRFALSPDGQYLFLTVGDRQRMTALARIRITALGKILRLTLDGKPAPGNPMAGKTGATSVSLINPPRDTGGRRPRPSSARITFEGRTRRPRRP